MVCTNLVKFTSLLVMSLTNCLPVVLELEKNNLAVRNCHYILIRFGFFFNQERSAEMTLFSFVIKSTSDYVVKTLDTD